MQLRFEKSILILGISGAWDVVISKVLLPATLGTRDAPVSDFVECRCGIVFAKIQSGWGVTRGRPVERLKRASSQLSIMIPSESPGEGLGNAVGQFSVGYFRHTFH